MALSLRGSVGLNGNNWYTDIATIQDLLNQIAVNYGGASPPFFTLGVYSQQLVDAIRRFQTVNGLYCDGRIDVNGPSFRKILTLLNKPLPPGAPAAPPNSGPSQPAPAGQPPSGVNMDKAFRGFRFSPWKLSGSAGFSAGASVIGISGGYLDLQYRDPADPDENYDGRLYFGAAGGGVSVAPVSMQYSTADMYSKSPWNILISPRQQNDMDFEDFQGLGAIISGGALSSVVPTGGSMSIYLFGINNLALPSYLIGAMFGGGLQMINLATIADAAVLSYGTTKGSPDMGISCQCGVFH